MVWYLGDGSLCEDRSICIYTNSFVKEDVKYLSIKLNDVGIINKVYLIPRAGTYLKNYYTIRISSRDISFFFKYIGSKSPINCYNYKFDFPEWFPGSLRISRITELYNFNRWNVQKIVKNLHGAEHRISPRGRIWIPETFLPRIIQELKKVKEK